MQLTIKLISALGAYKALVLDMSRSENRLVYMVTNQNAEAAYLEAEAWVKMRQGLTWH